MIGTNKWTLIFDEFMNNYPRMASDAIDWYPSGRSEIIIVMGDGSKLIYNGNTQRFSSVGCTDDIYLTEQEWRRKFAAKLYEKMTDKCISQKELAELLNMSQMTISKYLNARVTPTSYNLDRIARVLDCSIIELTNF